MIIELQPATVARAGSATSSHLVNQILVSIMSGFLCICGGFTYGYSAVLVPQIKDDDEFPYSEEYDSWIAAIAPLSMAFGCIFAGVLIDTFGRKYTHILLLWPFLLGYLIQAFTKNITYLLVGRFLTGMCTGLFRSIGAVYLVEVTDPETRAIFQFVLPLSSTVGILSSHVIGAYLCPKYSCTIFCVPIFFAFVLLIFLKESPLWLIAKGKIDEGVESFEWYRCKSEAAQKELTDVLEEYKYKTKSRTFIEVLSTIVSKKFLKAYSAGFVMFVTIQFCGVNNLIFYSNKLLKPIFSDEIDSYMLMLIVDSLRMFGNVLLIPVLKYCPRRKCFFIITLIVILLLIGKIVYLIVEPTGLTWLLLACLSTFITLGGIMISIGWTFVAEIFPNEIRGIGSGMIGCTSFLLMFVSVKLTLELIDNFGPVATYSFFAITTFVSMTILFFILPDTDGKSLHEIEKKL